MSKILGLKSDLPGLTHYLDLVVIGPELFISHDPQEEADPANPTWEAGSFARRRRQSIKSMN